MSDINKFKLHALDHFYLDGTIGRLPTIAAHTDSQLDAAIDRAMKEVPNFLVILHGIDAYIERRKRRRKRRFYERGAKADDAFFEADPWGNS